MTAYAYTRHSVEELADAREALHAPALQEFHRKRVESQAHDVSLRLDNIRMRLWEISDLMDDATGEPEKVSFRTLLETLRQTEVELEGAVGKLAGGLGLVPVDQQLKCDK
jgi:hypothetical protein